MTRWPHLRLTGLKVLAWEGADRTRPEPAADVVLLDGEWDAAALSALQPEGALLWAVRNPLSLQAWAGARDVATGLSYEAICGNPSDPLSPPLTLRESREFAIESGLTVLAEDLVYPGLHTATTLISRELAIRDPEFAARVAVSSFRPMAEMPRILAFPESLALVQAARGGLMPELAPAVLRILTRAPGGRIARQLLEPRTQGRELAWHHSRERRFPCRTVIRGTVDGDRVSVKESLSDEARTSPARLAGDADAPFAVEWLFGAEQPVLRGKPVLETLLQRLYARDWGGFEAELAAFATQAIRRHTDGRGALRPEALDATVINAVHAGTGDSRGSGAGCEFFDLEWRLAGAAAPVAMSASWFALRNVLVLARHSEYFAPEAPFASLRELYERLCARLQVSPSYEQDTELEARFQALASIRGDWRAQLGEVRAALEQSFALAWFARSPGEEFLMRKDYPRLVRESRTFGSRVARKLQKLLGHPAFEERI